MPGILELRLLGTLVAESAPGRHDQGPSTPPDIPGRGRQLRVAVAAALVRRASLPARRGLGPNL